MKKIILPLLCFLGISVSYLSGTAINIRVKAEVANVRQSPNITSRVIRQYQRGTILDVVEKIGSWFKIAIPTDAGNRLGYIHFSTVELLSSDDAPAPVRITKESPPEAKKEEELKESGSEKASSASKSSVRSFRIRSGLIAGVNLSKFGFDGDPSFESRFLFGFNFGGFLSFPLSRLLELQPQVLVIWKGCGFADSQGGFADWQTRLIYLEVPILIRANFALLHDKLIFSPLLGPYVSFKLSVPSALDYGFIFGLGSKFNCFGKSFLGIDLRYEIGLKTILYVQHHSDPWAAKNQTILFNLTYQF